MKSHDKHDTYKDRKQEMNESVGDDTFLDVFALCPDALHDRSGLAAVEDRRDT